MRNVFAVLLLVGTYAAAQAQEMTATAYEAALQRDPWHHDALIEYAATLGDAGRTRAMLDATRRALQARPASPQAYYLQAVLAARAGSYGLARSLLQRSCSELVT